MPDSIVGLEYLPNVHIENINYQKTTDQNYKTVTTVSMYDYSTRTWSLDDKFTSYLNVYHINIMSKVSIEDITLGQRMLSEFMNDTKKIINFNEMEKTEVTIRGKDYIKFKTTIESSAFLSSSGDLAVFCASFIDLEQLKQNEGLNLSYSTQSYMGSLKSEKIIENGEEISNSIVFRDEDGIPWSGPVHGMESIVGAATVFEGYMAGSQHGETPEKSLSLEVISNFSKIRYYNPIEIPSVDIIQRNLDSTAPSDLSEVPQAIPSARRDFSGTALGLSGLSSVVPNSQITPASSFLHQMEFVEDPNRNVLNSVVVDLASVVLSESPAASIMYRYDKEAFTRIAQATNIKHIEINRYPIRIGLSANRLGMFPARPDFSRPTLIARSHNNRQKVKNKTLFQISPTEIVSVDPTTLTQNNTVKSFNGRNLTLDMLKNASKIGKVEQLDLSLDPSLRPITFTDYSIKDAKDGRYKYRMKISIEDQHLLYCKQLLKDLMRTQKRIENLHDVLIIKNVYNGDEFNIEFLQEFYAQYNVSVNTETGFVEGEFNTQALQESYLVKSFELLLEAERLIGQTPRAPRMTNNLNLFSTDLDKINQTARYFGLIINRFKTTYDLSDGPSFEKSSTKSRKDRGVIEKIITLREEYKRELLMPIGINYINMNTQSEGLPILSMANFDTRASKEVSKFFTGPISTNSESLSIVPENIKSAIANIEETKYLNFSPANIIFAGNEVDTTEISPQSFNADFFNNIKIASVAMESEDDVDPSNIADEEQLENYLDSREYLGDTTKFNNIILNSILTKPALLPKIRKKFKFLDNSILKAKKRNISLKTFDLSQPDNFVVNNLMSEPNSVPLQIKALSLLKTPVTNFDLETIEFDPISNPQTQEVFMQNYLNIGKVQALMGFEKVNGRFLMDKPIYREINLQTHEKLKNMNVLCRVVPQSLEGLGVDHQKYNIHDKVFVMHSVNNTQVGEEDV